MHILTKLFKKSLEVIFSTFPVTRAFKILITKIGKIRIIVNHCQSAVSHPRIGVYVDSAAVIRIVRRIVVSVLTVAVAVVTAVIVTAVAMTGVELGWDKARRHRRWFGGYGDR